MLHNFNRLVINVATISFEQQWYDAQFACLCGVLCCETSVLRNQYYEIILLIQIVLH